MSETTPDYPPVSIEAGPADWQVIQQSEKGMADITLSGRWWTICERKKPEVLVRICREGAFTAIGRRFDLIPALTKTDRTAKGDDAGKRGTWKITLKDVPAGGPYRIETSVGSVEDAVEWRRGGATIQFLCVGDIWLIAGQSNAEGYGASVAVDPSEIGVHQFGDKGWQLAAHGRRSHPWLMFAKILKSELGYPIGLIPTAVGGTPMKRWTPGKEGDLFAGMKEQVVRAGGMIKGILWYQGESDSNEAADWNIYKKRFTRFADGVQRLGVRAETPIITVQLNRVLGDNHSVEGWEQIRESQRQLSHDLDQVFVISAFDSVLCDGIHNGSLGNQLIGQRAADVAMGGVFGRDVAFRHPECASARLTSSKVIELRFDNVEIRLDHTISLSNGAAFAVRDDAGDVPLTNITGVSKNKLRLYLGRKIEGSASVTGAPGTCPPHNLPKDISGYRPMLGFTMNVESGV